MKVEAGKKNALVVKPNVVVSVRDKEGKDNALVVAYAGNCSYDPPMAMVELKSRSAPSVTMSTLPVSVTPVVKVTLSLVVSMSPAV